MHLAMLLDHINDFDIEVSADEDLDKTSVMMESTGGRVVSAMQAKRREDDRANNVMPNSLGAKGTALIQCMKQQLKLSPMICHT